MLRTSVVVLLAVIAGLSCVRFEQRAPRYDKTACPICSEITNGKCSFCTGSGVCPSCKGEKERLTVSPNLVDDVPMKPFAYKSSCPFCKGSGKCSKCSGSGSCWACNGTARVDEHWECLNSRGAAAPVKSPE